MFRRLFARRPKELGPVLVYDGGVGIALLEFIQAALQTTQASPPTLPGSCASRDLQIRDAHRELCSLFMVISPTLARSRWI